MINTLYIPATSMTANITGSAIDTTDASHISFEAVWTGTPTGTLSAQGSNDSANWVNLANSSLALSGTASSTIFECYAPVFRYIRYVYTFTSGTGSLSVSVFSQTAFFK